MLCERKKLGQEEERKKKGDLGGSRFPGKCYQASKYIISCSGIHPAISEDIYNFLRVFLERKKKQPITIIAHEIGAHLGALDHVFFWLGHFYEGHHTN